MKCITETSLYIEIGMLFSDTNFITTCYLIHISPTANDMAIVFNAQTLSYK